MLIYLNNRIRRSRDDQGFTLIEFLIVIAILIALSLLALPFYLGAVKKGYVTSITSDISQSAINFSGAYNEACAGNLDCVPPTQSDWTSSIRVTSNANNIVTAYLYKPGSVTTSANAESADANDYYSQGIVCIQGVANKIQNPADKDRTWSYYFVLAQGGNITASKTGNVGNVSGSDVSGNVRQGGCDGLTVGNPQLNNSSTYLNNNAALTAAMVGSWVVTNVYN